MNGNEVRNSRVKRKIFQRDSRKSGQNLVSESDAGSVKQIVGDNDGRIGILAAALLVLMLFAYLVIRQNPSIDKFAGVVAAFIGFGLIAYLVLNPGLAYNANVFAFVRIVLSLSTAVFGATIPGFLEISYEGAGWVISAAGALALFVLTYFFTPKVLGSAEDRRPPLDSAGPMV